MTRNHSTHAGLARALFALVVAVVGALVLAASAVASPVMRQPVSTRSAGAPADDAPVQAVHPTGVQPCACPNE